MEFLRQRAAPQSASRLDSVADGIAAIVIGSDSSAAQHAGAARLVAELVTAGLPTDGGIPYSKSMDVLIQIGRSAHDRRIRGLVMWLLPELPGRQRAWEFLRSIAGNPAPPDDELAPRLALGVLLTYADQDPEVLQILRGLWDGRSVTDSMARRQLEAFARLRGWTTA